MYVEQFNGAQTFNMEPNSDLYGRYNDLSNAFFTRDQMLDFGVCPNVFTYNALILAQVKSGNFHGA